MNHSLDRSPPTSSLAPARAPAHPFAAPHDYLHTEHGKVALYRFGRGPDVVFVHGWPLHAATFRHIVPRLAEHYTLHFMDLPATGASLEWSARIDLPALAGVVRRVVDHLAPRSYALVAHDSGGVVARLVAAADPRVAALVVSGSEMPGHRPAIVEMLMKAIRMPGAVSLLRTALRSDTYLKSSKAFGACFDDPAYVLGDFHDLFVAPLIASRSVLDGQTRLVASFDFAVIDALRETHARIQAPTLCLWGERDPFFPVDLARAMLPQFGGGAELAVVPGAKLYVHEDHPEDFAAHTRAFLARHPT